MTSSLLFPSGPIDCACGWYAKEREMSNHSHRVRMGPSLELWKESTGDNSLSFIYKHSIISFVLLSRLCRTIDEMDTTVRLDDITHLTDLEGKRGVFERLLHLAAFECAEIAIARGRRAV